MDWRACITRPSDFKSDAIDHSANPPIEVGPKGLKMYGPTKVYGNGAVMLAG